MIQMIAGKYGMYTDGKVIGMTRESGPFSIDAEREAELVAAGIAEYVYDSSGAPIGFDEQPPELPDLPDGVTAIPEYSEDMTVKELRDIGKLCGLTFKVGMTKKEMVDALDAHIEANMVEGEPEEPINESAPTFDPAEAVQ